MTKSRGKEGTHHKRPDQGLLQASGQDRIALLTYRVLSLGPLSSWVGSLYNLVTSVCVCGMETACLTVATLPCPLSIHWFLGSCVADVEFSPSYIERMPESWCSLSALSNEPEPQNHSVCVLSWWWEGISLLLQEEAKQELVRLLSC